MKSYEKKHLHIRLFHQNKNDWLLLNGPLFSDHPRNEISFNIARNKNYCKQNFFYGGLKFYFGSHVNTASLLCFKILQIIIKTFFLIRRQYFIRIIGNILLLFSLCRLYRCNVMRENVLASYFQAFIKEIMHVMHTQNFPKKLVFLVCMSGGKRCQFFGKFSARTK